MAKRTQGELEPEEALRLSGYPVETAHGVDKEHPDETVEQWAARMRDKPEEAVKQQREAAEKQEAEAAKETTDG